MLLGGHQPPSMPESRPTGPARAAARTRTARSNRAGTRRSVALRPIVEDLRQRAPERTWRRALRHVGHERLEPLPDERRQLGNPGATLRMRSDRWGRRAGHGHGRPNASQLVPLMATGTSGTPARIAKNAAPSFSGRHQPLADVDPALPRHRQDRAGRRGRPRRGASPRSGPGRRAGTARRCRPSA